MSKKEIVNVRCKGRRRDTNILCNEILYQSDGEFLYVAGMTLNPHLKAQKIQCDKCGYLMHWKRNEKFQTNLQKGQPVPGKDLFIFERKK